MVKKFFFLVTRPPYKSENPKLALTHSLGSYMVSLHIDEEAEPIVAFVGDGVLNCVRDQKSDEFYGLGSNEGHLKKMLASDMKVLVCKEDLEKFGISEDRLVDAKDMGAETTIKVVSFEEILKEMENADHVLFF